MILINRGAEPLVLKGIRTKQLLTLRTLGRIPTSTDIVGYKEMTIANALWRAQHFKCCYCEHKITRSFNDIEHYRPKSSANREPGSALRHGYWWLAFTWENFLFSCPTCNRSSKNDLFPLAKGSVALVSEDVPPGKEQPLLINPAETTNPVEHIEFVFQTVAPKGGPKQWWARSRNGSHLGSMTIEVCELNRDELLELRGDYFETTISPQAQHLNDAINRQKKEDIDKEFARALSLFSAKSPYAALAYDALCMHVDKSKLHAAIGKTWPDLTNVGR